MAIQTSLGSLLLVYFIIVIFNNNRKYMYFDLNRIIYFNIFMVNLLKVKTIRNFINVVKIGIVLFKYWADRSNIFVYRIPVY